MIPNSRKDYFRHFSNYFEKILVLLNLIMVAPFCYFDLGLKLNS